MGIYYQEERENIVFRTMLLLCREGHMQTVHELVKTLVLTIHAIHLIYIIAL